MGGSRGELPGRDHSNCSRRNPTRMGRKWSAIEHFLLSVIDVYSPCTHSSRRDSSRTSSAGIYTRLHTGAIWMPTIYAKNEAENIAAHILRRIKEEIDG